MFGDADQAERNRHALQGPRAQLYSATLRNPPPVYATPLVAQMILHAAEHPSRDLIVGGGGAMLALLANSARRSPSR